MFFEVTVLPDFLFTLQDYISFSDSFTTMHFYIILYRHTHTKKGEKSTKQTNNCKANQPEKKNALK